jgi:hypothetical protein
MLVAMKNLIFGGHVFWSLLKSELMPWGNITGAIFSNREKAQVETSRK